MKILFRVLLFIAILFLLLFILWNGLAGSSHNVPQSTYNAIHLSEIISAIAVAAFGYLLWKIKKKDQDNRSPY